LDRSALLVSRVQRDRQERLARVLVGMLEQWDHQEVLVLLETRVTLEQQETLASLEWSVCLDIRDQLEIQDFLGFLALPVPRELLDSRARQALRERRVLLV
jgi:hypothetical protein